MKFQRETNIKVPSVSTMGYLTMIVALAPGMSAFSGVEQPVRTASLKPSTGSTYKPRRTSTRVAYISEASNGDVSQQSNHQQEEGQGPVWWNSIFGGGHADQSSAAADDYLEFLDRRYNRILHDENEQPQSSEQTQGFNVLNWLYQDSDSNNANNNKKSDKEDALYVLGVANLASKKLLQKHHRLREAYHQRKAEASSSRNHQKRMDATDAEIVDTTTTSMAAPLALFRQAAQQRELLVQGQVKSVRLAAAFVLRSMLTCPIKALRKLFIVGGGKKSMAMAFAAVAALSIMVRPILRVAAKELGANSMSP